MYSDLGVTTTTRGTGGPSWAAEFPVDCAPITIDADAVLAVYTDGHIPSGACLALVTATNRFAPYGGTSDEVQTITEGGSGLTSFTLTYSGQTTTSIAAAATAATVQAALEALSNIAVGDVTVTGSAGGPYTVTFGGTLANTNVAALTATPTGGTGTVTIATPTAGGAELGTAGTETAKGFLLNDRLVRAGRHVDAALYYRGRVYEDLLPANSRFDPAARTELTPNIYFDKVGA